MFKNYLKIIIRNIFRYKGYSIINILGLAVGMASCILILLYVQDEFSYDRYVEFPDRTHRVIVDFSAGDRGEVSTARTPPPWGPVLANDFPEIESYVRLKSPLVSWLVSYEEENKRFYEKGFYFADETVFDFFNLKMIQGDPELALSEPSTVVISETIADKYFGNENPLGRVLRLDNSYNFRITGIMEEMPHNSHFHSDFLASFNTLHSIENGPYGDNYGNDMGQLFPDVFTYVRLPKDYEVSGFNEKMVGFIDRYHGQILTQINGDLVATLQPLTEIHLKSHLEGELQANSDKSYVLIFLAIAIFVLIIACINFMNLATARSSDRAREVGMRKVVGARRTQLMMQFMGESIAMTFVALIVALGLVYLLLPAFNNLASKMLSLSVIDSTFILGLVGLVILVGIISGSYPALFLSSFSPSAVLQSSSRSGSSSSATLRKALVVFQFTISIVLIIGTGIVGKQMAYLQEKDLGFNEDQVVIISLGDTDQRLVYDNYKNLILQNPNVTTVSGVLVPPGGLLGNIAFTPEGATEGETVLMDFYAGDHDFVNAFELEIVKGRTFSQDFPTDTLQAFILNETAVKQLGWEDDPIGKEFDFGPQAPFRPRVVGVVKDFHVKSLYSKIEPLVIGFMQQPIYLAIRIRPNNISETLSFLEEQWPIVYPNDPFQFTFLDEDFDNQYKAEQVRGKVFGAFSILAICIACLGLLGLASFTAEQRTREIGIRKVMGASVTSIIIMLTRDFVKLVTIASIIAWPISYFLMNNWLQNFAYSVGLSLWIFVVAALAAVTITVITVGYQATRAAMTNPVDAFAASLTEMVYAKSLVDNILSLRSRENKLPQKSNLAR